MCSNMCHLYSIIIIYYPKVSSESFVVTHGLGLVLWGHRLSGSAKRKCVVVAVVMAVTIAVAAVAVAVVVVVVVVAVVVAAIVDSQKKMVNLVKS